VILFVDELHTIIGAGAAEGAIDAANIIKPALGRGGSRSSAPRRSTRYRKYIEKDAALERRFQLSPWTSPRGGERRHHRGLRTSMRPTTS
jgi:ATP-dependent Clp protease ATP-binding subunit ClpA